MITFSPEARLPESLKHILFPSDFGGPSRRAFESTVTLAKRLGAKITLFYKQPPVVMPAYVGAPVMVYDYSEEDEKARQRIATTWVDWAKNQGCEASLYVDNRPGYVADAVTAYAKAKGVDMISMAGQSGPVSTLVLGSIARQVLQTSEVPVWVRRC